MADKTPSPPKKRQATLAEVLRLGSTSNRVSMTVNTAPRLTPARAPAAAPAAVERDDTWEAEFATEVVDLREPPPAGFDPASWGSIDALFVKLPSAKNNRYKRNGKLVSKWYLLKSVLGDDTITVGSVDELWTLMVSYLPRFRKKWKLRALRRFVEMAAQPSPLAPAAQPTAPLLFSFLLPGIRKLALRLPDVMKRPLPLLATGVDRCITLSQEQIAVLLANAFLCTFPMRNWVPHDSVYASYPRVHFSTLFNATSARAWAEGDLHPKMVAKFRCILHYFHRVLTAMPTGAVSFHRRVLFAHDVPDWRRSTRALAAVTVRPTGVIEDVRDMALQADFANAHIGGGVLGTGCVQEEIRFLLAPELLVTRLFTEKLADNETLHMWGAETFNTCTGYASSFRWAGTHVDTTARDAHGRRGTQIVAIDALRFPPDSLLRQYQPRTLLRELNKVYCGARAGNGGVSALTDPMLPLATGNWGSGAFNGDRELKAVLQLMACAEAKRDVIYYAFEDSAVCDGIRNLHRVCSDRSVTVAQLWLALNEFRDVLYTHQRATATVSSTSSTWSLPSTASVDSAAAADDMPPPGTPSLFAFLMRRFTRPPAPSPDGRDPHSPPLSPTASTVSFASEDEGEDEGEVDLLADTEH